MNINILSRFNELEIEMNNVKNTRTEGTGEFSKGFKYVDNSIFIEWSLKVQNLIILTVGEDSMYCKEFEKTKKTSSFITNANIFDKQQALFKAFKNDYENGLLTSLQSLVQAEVFDNELEQAEELLNKKYKTAAAVIAGVVLETGLRSLCSNLSISHGKLDKMNSDLSKKGIYNKLQQKKITALADIRNNAAHGKEQEFTHDDVKTMIRDVESFLAIYIK